MISQTIVRPLSTTLLVLTLGSLSLPAVAQQPISAVSQPVPTVPTIPTSQPALDPSDYTLGVGDKLRIDIFQAKDYSGEYFVLNDGTVNLPLIGKVKAKGLTLAQMTTSVSRKYAEYLRVPTVTVILSEPRPLKIAIAGEIGRPGAYEIALKDNLQYPSVTDLLELAGGVTTTADIHQVEIRRVVQGKKQVLTADLGDFLQQGNSEQDLMLQDGDTIFIPTVREINVAETNLLTSANFGIQPVDSLNVAVVGEVYNPGTHTIEAEKGEDEETLKPDLPRLTEAISLAGGIKPLADVRRVEVHRLTRTGTQQVISVNLWELMTTGDTNKDLILQKGDTIVVPKADKVETAETAMLASTTIAPKTIRVSVVGEVKKPGVIEVQPNTPLNHAILAAGGFDAERAKKESVELIRLNPDGTVTKQEIKIDLSKDIVATNNPALHKDDVIMVGRSNPTKVGDRLQTFFKPLGYIFPFLTLFGL